MTGLIEELIADYTKVTALKPDSDRVSRIETAAHAMAPFMERPHVADQSRAYFAALAMGIIDNDRYFRAVENSVLMGRWFETICLLNMYPNLNKILTAFPIEPSPVSPEDFEKASIKPIEKDGQLYWPVKGRWAWPNFPPSEMACQGTNKLNVEPLLMELLQLARAKNGDKPLIIASGYRTPWHNDRVPGAASNSQHIYGKASDIRIGTSDPFKLMKAVEQAGHELGLEASIAQYANRKTPRLHVDVRDGRPWRAAPGGAFVRGRSYRINDDEEVSERPKVRVEAIATASGGVLGVGGATAGLNGGSENSSAPAQNSYPHAENSSDLSIFDSIPDAITFMNRASDFILDIGIWAASIVMGVYVTWAYWREIYAYVRAVLRKWRSL